jgi:pimeloyl-ACP methyl ester carboxylesterase
MFTPSYLLVEGPRGRLHVGMLGETKARPLVVMHFGGGGFGRDQWAPLDQLAGEGWRLIRIDRRGYGLSDPRPEGFPQDFFQRDLEELEAVLDEVLSGQRFHLLGTSDGGTLSLMYAAAHTDRVLALAVDGAHWRAEDCMNASMDEMESRFVERFGSDPSRDDVRTATLRAWFVGWRRLIEQGWSMEEQLACVTCPVAVLQGSNDGVVPDEHAHQLARLTGGESFILEGGAHLSLRSHPTEYMAWLQAFLAKHL